MPQRYLGTLYILIAVLMGAFNIHRALESGTDRLILLISLRVVIVCAMLAALSFGRTKITEENTLQIQFAFFMVNLIAETSLFVRS
jgi:hypothetical protein